MIIPLTAFMSNMTTEELLRAMIICSYELAYVSPVNELVLLASPALSPSTKST